MKKTIQQYNNLSDSFGRRVHHPAPDVRGYFHNNYYYNKTGKGKHLDICSGAGVVSMHFMDRCWDTYCIDGAEKMLDECEKNGIPQENLTLLNLEKEKITLEKNSFDIVTCHSGLQFLNNSCDIIKQMIELAKTDGIIVFDIPHQSSRISPIPVNIGEYNLYIPSKNCIEQAIKEANGEIIETMKRINDNIDIDHELNIFTIRKLTHQP